MHCIHSYQDQSLHLHSGRYGYIKVTEIKVTEIELNIRGKTVLNFQSVTKAFIYFDVMGTIFLFNGNVSINKIVKKNQNKI